ncbi:hypothetical protein AQUCO_00700081v1 [Aquilegia coerulea]|uniref:Hydrophobic seed protein domain-containing protein n=1 Tax=Aquilegia coerulea TaxID=218851 RepID=A0A2G5EIG5_AQUCA|nr:hypothetical protein AQUCO_00700081v1 [Aquilegia coerulea]
MASKTQTSAAFFLALNLLFFSMSVIADPICSIDPPQLNVCADILGIQLAITTHSHPCCTLIHGLSDLEASLCVCNALKANILGIDLTLKVGIVFTTCQKTLPSGYTCIV